MGGKVHKDRGAPLTARQISDKEIQIRLGPGWNNGDPAKHLPTADKFLSSARDDTRVSFANEGLDRQDAITVSLVIKLIQTAQKRQFEVDTTALPESMRKLVNLATSVPRSERPADQEENFVTRVGMKTVEFFNSAKDFVEFLGQLFYSFFRLITGRAQYRKSDFWITLQECGASALPIVSLISILTGMILAFVGAVQLRKFGATIYMTDLVGLAMAREMGAIMVGIIMSGRTGAAFAAQIGSMNVNQEVDALETLDISPVEFLVLPRTIALILMMPLLTIYADIVGWIGAFFVAMPMDINPAEFWNQLTESLGLDHILFGLSKSFFFGIVVATTGCYYGLKSGRSSAAVGTATTRAVVAGITWIVILDAFFAILAELL